MIAVSLNKKIVFPILLCCLAITPLITVDCTCAQKKISNNELKLISKDLRDSDVNKISGLQLVFGEKIIDKKDKADKAPNKLCKNFDQESLKTKTTFKKLIALFDNYIPNVKQQENENAEEEREIDEFLDAIMNTEVLQKAHEFLISHCFSPSDTTQFKKQLRELWFRGYSRSGNSVTGSSGFEHVFLLEIKKKEITGGHNWVYFCTEETKNKTNYEGYFNINNMKNVLEFRYRWGKYLKPLNTMMIGTTPEYEIAISTICFFARPNKACKIVFDGKIIKIQTFAADCGFEKCVNTAYADLS